MCGTSVLSVSCALAHHSGALCVLLCDVAMPCCVVLRDGVGGRVGGGRERGWLVRTAWQPAVGTPGREGSHCPQPPGLDRASRSEIKRSAGLRLGWRRRKGKEGGQVIAAED